MKNKIRNFLFQLGAVSWIEKIYIQVYRLAIWRVSNILLKKDYIQGIYLKGSFEKHYFIPVISDLDFFIIGDDNEENKLELQRLFKKMNKFFPMVSDFDFHSEENFKLLIQYGGLKYIDVDQWIPIKGEKLDLLYRFHPKKFAIDIAHEIYFQFEWLFRNIRTRKVGCYYSTYLLYRQFCKIKDLLVYADEFEQKKYYIHRETPKLNKRWLKYSNDHILYLFNSIVENSEYIRILRAYLFKDFEKWDFGKTLKERFFLENVQILVADDKLDTKKNIFFTLNNLKLFYFSGCMDSYLLFEGIIKKPHLLSSKYLELLYYTRLLEKRYNHRHDSYFYSINFDKSKKLMSEIEDKVRFEKYAPKSYFGKNILIYPCVEIKSEIIEKLLSFIAPDSELLIVKLGEDEFHFEDKRVSILNFMNFKIMTHLNQKIPCLNTGIDWVFGANNVVVLDQESIPEGSFYWDRLNSTTSPGQFACGVSYKANHYCWSGLGQDWNSFLPIFPKENLDNLHKLIEYQISGYMTKDAPIQNIKNEDSVAKKFYHINFTEMIFEPLNTDEVHYPVRLQNWLDIDSFGFLELKHEFIENYGDLATLFNKDLKNPYFKLEILNNVSQDERLREGLLGVELDRNSYFHISGPAVTVEENEKGIIFRTSAQTVNEIKIKIRADELYNYNFIGIIYDFSFENRIFDEALKVIDKENQMKLEWSGQELYKFQLFVTPGKFENPNHLNLNLKLNPNTTYMFKLNEKKSIESLSDDKYDFYRTVNLVDKDPILRLGEFYTGFYKFVIYSQTPVSGSFSLRTRENRKCYQKLEVKQQTITILYLYCENNLNDLLLISDLEMDMKNYNLRVDILRLHPDFF